MDSDLRAILIIPTYINEKNYGVSKENKGLKIFDGPDTARAERP